MGVAQIGACELCGRAAIEVTRHHLIPRTRHRTKRNRKMFDREDVRTRLAMLCRACHRFVHAALPEKSLEESYNTVDQLARHPEVARFVEWVRTKPPGLRVHSRTPKL